MINNKKIKVLELFGGIGAPRKALLNLGFNIKSIDYVEIDINAVKSYNALFEHLKEPESVVGYTLKPDILIHGSPCQTFSNASNGIHQLDVANTLDEYIVRQENGDNVKSDLFWETLRIIDNLGQWRPEIVIWENVPSVLQDNNIKAFNSYITHMEEMGYINSYEILDARDFGIPQSRRRMFCVSILNGEKFDFINLEKKVMKNLNYFLEEEVDEKYIIKAPSMIKAIEQGKMKKLNLSDPNECTPTITTKQMRWNVGIIPVGNEWRNLTPRECWRLMGFSDEDFDKVSSVVGKTALYQQAGNSIVVDVLEAIFKELFKEA